MNEETLYSVPVKKPGDESTNLPQSEKLDEKKLLAAIESEEAMSSKDYPRLFLMLGKLYFSGRTSAGEPDNALAVKYLEQGLELAPLEGRDYAGLLGEAYEAWGRKINAIHWYRVAVEEFGQAQYRKPLYRLYLTGMAGAAKKREAEEQLQWMDC